MSGKPFFFPTALTLFNFRSRMQLYITPFVLSVGSEGAEVEGLNDFISPFDFGPFDPSTSSGLRALRSGRTALNPETKECQSTMVTQ